MQFKEEKETLPVSGKRIADIISRNLATLVMFFFFSCSRDSSLQYVYKKSSLQKFTFKAFRFRYVASERLYVHCKVVTCRMSDVGSVCDRGCKEDRRQRRENTKFIMDKDVFLSLGPVTFQDQGEGQYEEIIILLVVIHAV